MNDHLDYNSEDDATDYDLSSFGDELKFDNEINRQLAMEEADDQLLGGFKEAGDFPPRSRTVCP